jgi:hypothetical protein
MLKTQWTRRTALWSILALGSIGGFVACDNDDGPAEKVGEAIDDAADDVKDAAEDVKDAVDKD